LKILIDTNVLIAAAFLNHEWNSKAALQVEKVINQEVTGFISAHSIAEFYAVATRYPLSPMPTTAVQQFLDDTLQYFEIIELSSADYKTVIAQVSQLGLVSGAIFDALIAHAALKAKVNQLVTFNPKHFTRIGIEIEKLVYTP
jgi:predicted nucleic acid-binding protein